MLGLSRVERDVQHAYRSAPPVSEDVDPKKEVPTPIVKIDNKVDNFATVLSVEFGNELGELLDTVGPHSKLGCPIAGTMLPNFGLQAEAAQDSPNPNPF